MIQLVPQMRILLATEPTDFRKGIDGLAALCRSAIRADPFSGVLFVFANRKRTAIRVLTYDGTGFWLCTKRLSRGKFRGWPQGGEVGVAPMAAAELQVLLANGDPARARFGETWRRITG